MLWFSTDEGTEALLVRQLFESLGEGLLRQTLQRSRLKLLDVGGQDDDRKVRDLPGSSHRQGQAVEPLADDGDGRDALLVETDCVVETPRGAGASVPHPDECGVAGGGQLLHGLFGSAA